MISVRNVIKYIKAEDDNLTIDNRLFLNIIIVGFITCAISSIMFAIFPPSIVVTIISFSYLVLLPIIYYFVRIKGYYKSFKIPLIFIAFATIVLLWIFNGGINGADIILGLIVLMLALILIPSRKKIYIISSFIIITVFIYLLQYFKPGLIVGFQNETYRWYDNIIKVIFSSIIILLTINFFIKHYTIERKRAEESEARYKSIYENSTIGLYRTTPDGKILLTNPWLVKRLGYSSFEELVNRNLENEGFEPTYDRKHFIKLLETNGEVKGLEAVWKCFDGTNFYVRESARAIRDENGNILYFDGSVEDITENKLAEAELIKAKEISEENAKKLHQLNDDKDRFITIISHDLKSPFNALLGFLSLLTNNLHKYEISKIERQLNIISTSANNVYKLLEEILLWAQSQSGKLPYNPLYLSFSEICDEVLSELKLFADNKNIQINKFVPDNLSVYADLYMLKTILRNIISNAVKFTGKNGNVIIETEPGKYFVTVKVIDSGTGIAPERLQNLFNYSQIMSDKGTENETGTGLGILICKEFINKHGGKLWVESEVGKGSKFNFTLPLTSNY